MSNETNKPANRFAFYLGADAPAFSEVDVLEFEGVTPEVRAHLDELHEAGFDEGQTVKLLFSAPGFSLTYAWFKSAFPLPRHSHNSDCLYYVVAGSLALGTKVLRAGDGFFVPCDAGYTYVPGPDGVEVLEFRHSERFNIKFLTGNPSFWANAVETVRAERSNWAHQQRPQDLAVVPA